MIFHKSSNWTLLAALALLLTACSLEAADNTVTSSQASDSDTVAVIAGKAITHHELTQALAPELQALESQRHQLLAAGLERLIEERLIETEAQKRETTVEELISTELESKIAVTDAEVDTWFEENSARVRQPKEEIAERIRDYLAQQNQLSRRQTFVSNLRQKYAVEVRLEPLRLKIEATTAPSKGATDAVVTVVEFSDFQCPACRTINPAIQQIHQKYGDRVRIAFRQFPLHSIHPQAQKAAEAALCARAQGQFWEMHDALFAHQSELEVDQLKAHASSINLDSEKFDRCLDDETMKEAVEADLEAGRRAGVSGTPALFVNGRPLSLNQGSPLVDQIAALIDDELGRVGASSKGTK